MVLYRYKADAHQALRAVESVELDMDADVEK